MDSIGAIRNCGSDRMIRAAFFVKNQFVLSSVLIRRAALDVVGVFDESVPRGTIEDYELWSRIARKYRVTNVRKPMTGYRIHDGNISKQHHRAFLEAFRIMHAKYGDDFPMAWILRVKMWREMLAIRRLGDLDDHPRDGPPCDRRAQRRIRGDAPAQR